MIDIQDKNICPTLEEMGQYIRNSVFLEFCSEIKRLYQCKEKIEFSSCSWEKGWNLKLKKGGKTLCTVYPREHYFTVMIVVGRNEQKFVERFCRNVRHSYRKFITRQKKETGRDG